MRIKGSILLTSLILTFGQILSGALPAHSVELGQDATGDPNAVQIQGNTSGFLYSERIILTAAHVLNQLRIQPNGDTDGFVYAPGLADKTSAKRYQIIKAFIPNQLLARFGADITLVLINNFLVQNFAGASRGNLLSRNSSHRNHGDGKGN